MASSSTTASSLGSICFIPVIMVFVRGVLRPNFSNVESLYSNESVSSINISSKEVSEIVDVCAGVQGK